MEKNRNIFVTFILSIFPPLGHVYCGEIKRGYLLFFLSLIIPTICFAVKITSSFEGFVAVALVSLSFYIFLIIDALRIAKKKKKCAITKINRWYFYVLLIILSLILFGLNNVIQNHGIKSALRFRINGNSMSPSINHGDILIADSTYYNNSAIQHGDVIFFYQGNIPYISRCVAVSGDNIKISSGSLYLNGQVVEERYVSKSNWMKNNEAYDYVIDVPKEHIFILSDNRDNASDSRNIGAIPHSQIGGKILYILFSTKLENIGKSIF